MVLTNNKNWTAFISAGASGIGLAIGEALELAGYDIIICDMDEKALQKTSNDKGWQAYLCDVSDAKAVQGLFDKIASPINILVNNAGIAGPTSYVEDIAIADWQRCLSVSLDSHFYCTKAAVPQMKQRRQGVIINIASTAGLYGFPNRSPYAAAKWAVCGLTKSWAMELGEFNIRVNAIAPGSVEGKRMQRVIKAHAALENRSIEDIRKEYCLGTSMGSFVSAEDIADSVCFLCSDKARYISGQIIAVDGNTETLHVRQ